MKPPGLLFTCSFDDGHPSDLRTAELLAKHGVRATFYLPISNREGYPVLNASQMRELAQGFEIGSHTHDHCFLPALEAAAAQRQIRTGKQRLEQVLGQPSAGFCYPGGKYGQRELALVRAAGFEYARTTMNLCLAPSDSVFEMPTTLQFYPHPRQVLVRNFVRHGRWHSRGAVLYQALSRSDWGERLQVLLEHAAARGG